MPERTESQEFEPALATVAAIANKSTTARADRSARMDNRSSRRQHRTLWPRRRQRDTGRRAERRNYTIPAEPALFPGQPRPDDLRDQGRRARCGPESSSASSASSRTGRSASSSCLRRDDLMCGVGQRRSGRTGRRGLEGRDVLDTDEHAVTGGVVG